MITYAAMSLNEFADSMLVSRLLGSEAMDAEEDMAENILVLRSIADEIQNEYILGMNATRIIIRGLDARTRT